MKQKEKGNSKNPTKKINLYFKVFNALRNSTNLSKIQEELNISKQQLNYYLRRLKKEGLVINKSRGLWEIVKSSKNPTKYGSLLPKDFTRGHGYVVNIKLPKGIDKWGNRIEILKKNNIHYKLVGAKLTTPRIKALGRKVWLCNDHIRIFDKKEQSYYGKNAIESKKIVFAEFYKIIGVIENKLGINLRPYNFDWKKEHYALIKNDLAIDQNRKGVIIRVSDEKGEWLLIDDSLGEGGELENTGKKSLVTNLKMQRWWNEHKKQNFQVTPTFVLNGFNKLTSAVSDNQQLISGLPSMLNKWGKQLNQYRIENKSHLKLIQEYRKENISWRKGKVKELKKNINQTNLRGWI